MARRAEWEWGFSRARRWISSGWEPVLTGALVAVFAGELLLGAVAAYLVWGPTWLAMNAVALVVLVRLLSSRFGRGSLRLAALLVILVIGSGVMSVGRAEQVERRRRDARAVATRLGREGAVLLAGPVATPTGEARTKARVAVDALKAAAATVPDAATSLVAGQIASELDSGLAQGSLAAAVGRAGELRALLPAPADPPNRLVGARVAEAIEVLNDVVARTQVESALAGVRTLCELGKGAWSGVPGQPCVATTGDRDGRGREGAPDRSAVATTQATAGLALAQAAAATALEPAVAAARQLVDIREKALADALANTGSPTPATEMVDFLREGGNAAVRRLPLVDRRDAPFALAIVGWLVVAGIAILGYRHMEIINGTDGLGPVRVKGPDDDVEQFRTYLLWNVQEPGAVPGASALKPVTDLLGATAGGVPGAAWLQRLIEAVTAAVAIDHGYTVEFDVLEDGGPAGATVAVRVHVTRTGELIGQHVAVRPTKKVAERSAAYWAAAVILARSRKVPDWAEWSKDTSDSLAAYFERSDAEGGEIDRLREAVERAPTSGLLGLDLANAEAIRGNQLRAFQLALRVSTIHPRYVASRYRLAVTASLLASNLTKHWKEAVAADRAAVLAALERYQRPPTELINALRGDASDDRRETLLCEFAVTELDVLRVDTSRRWVIFKALRQRERSYWFELIRPARGGKSLRGQFRQSIESCKPAVKARGELVVGHEEMVMQEHRVLDPRTLWLVAYNLACCHAIWHKHGSQHPATEPTGANCDHAAAAVEYLEIAVERPGSYQLNWAWLAADPDLETLHGDARFRRFQESLYRESRATVATAESGKAGKA